MRKLFLIIVLALTYTSCEENVQFNNPGFQAFRDNVLWKGLSAFAYQSNTGAINIEALAEDGEVNLRIPSSNVGTYIVGTSTNRVATYRYTKDGADIFYTTGIDVGNGEIRITSKEDNTITGTFKFNARNIDNNPLGGELVNFQYGAFYKIPIIPE